jgi:hypothetical protein
MNIDTAEQLAMDVNNTSSIKNVERKSYNYNNNATRRKFRDKKEKHLTLDDVKSGMTRFQKWGNCVKNNIELGKSLHSYFIDNCYKSIDENESIRNESQLEFFKSFYKDDAVAMSKYNNNLKLKSINNDKK